MTVPLRAYREVPVDPLQEKVVIDTPTTTTPDRNGHIPELGNDGKIYAEHDPTRSVFGPAYPAKYVTTVRMSAAQHRP